MRDTNKTSKKLLIVFLAIMVLTLGGATIWLTALRGESDQKDINTTKQLTDDGSLTKLSFVAAADKSVLDQLKTHAKQVETKDSQYGAYVDAINGKKGGEEGKYWTFYVDGKMADKGAADYITKGGEKIEWKFE